MTPSVPPARVASRLLVFSALAIAHLSATATSVAAAVGSTHGAQHEIHLDDQRSVATHDDVGTASYANQVADCMAFLKQHMPASDRPGGWSHIPERDLLLNTHLALKARAANPWASAVPWSVFQEYVLPYASLDEQRDVAFWRPAFFLAFLPIAQKAGSLADAAQALNVQAWLPWGIHYKANQTPAIMSVKQTIAAGFASCTGLSIFLVSALRSVGIPARVTGIADWVQQVPTTKDAGRRVSLADLVQADTLGARARRPVIEAATCDDCRNHNWVEVWTGDGSWSFMGSEEPGPWNTTWFFPQPVKNSIPGDRRHAVWAVTFKRKEGGGSYPEIWNWTYTGVPAVDVTQYYLDAGGTVCPDCPPSS